MDSGAALSRAEVLIGRRQDLRHRLDFSARLVGATANVRVQIEDISAGGACIRLMRPLTDNSARLCWLNFAVFGRVAWKDDLRCGLMFDERLSEECLAQTVEFGDMMLKDRSDKFLKLASAWVHGPGDW